MSIMQWRRHTALVRAGAATVLGLVAGAVAAWLGPWQLATLIGWDIVAFTYIALVWAVIGTMDAEQTGRNASREDPSHRAADMLLLGASVGSLIALVFVLLHAGQSKGAAQALHVALGIASVLLSWALIHTTFVLRYARIFYGARAGGVNFNQEEPPTYVDFAYLAFTVGMTFQVSDTALQSHHIRATALKHALLSYLFGTIIVAMTINLIAGLAK